MRMGWCIGSFGQCFQTQTRTLDGYLPFKRRIVMATSTVLLVILVLIILGAVPIWPYSRSWGYGPSGILGVILVIFLVLLLLGGI
jgi:hypothetical protein